MQFSHTATVSLNVVPQLQWIWHSPDLSSFIVGDERTAFALPQDNATKVLRLSAARPFDASSNFHHPCNLPIPDTLYEEFSNQGWHGFRFLPAVAYDTALDDEGYPVGNLLLTLVFGPDYGQYVSYQSSNLILSLRSGSIGLFRHSPTGFEKVDETRTRGRAALAFAAHPSEKLIAYGDNYGNFHSHRFNADGFGKTKKIVAMPYKASALEFIDDGRQLLIGGTGYLAGYAFAENAFAEQHRMSGPVRDFQWHAASRIVFVNQGIHGVAAFHYDNSGFTKVAAVSPEGAVQKMVVSRCARYLAVTLHNSPIVSVYSIIAE